VHVFIVVSIIYRTENIEVLMLSVRTRRATAGFVLSSVVALAVGCNQSTEVPLVKFPENMPPPPVAPKNDGKGPQGANTSQGDPSQFTK
jgi:hypothetical protein